MQRAKTTLLIATLRELLAADGVKTQGAIKQALQQRGIEVNQSKISRSLHKIGAIKTKNTLGEIVYQLPKEPSPPPTAELTNLIIDIVNNDIMIIVHTAPGSASLIARLLDHNMQKLEILGTVAGDDTIIVIPKTIKKTPAIMKAVKNFLMNLK